MIRECWSCKQSSRDIQQCQDCRRGFCRGCRCGAFGREVRCHECEQAFGRALQTSMREKEKTK